MEFEITYENYFEEKIDFNQIDFSKKYLKVYSANGILKKKEEYEEDKITHLIYYLNSNEKIQEVLNENSTIKSIEIIITEYIGEYRKLTHKDFDNGELYGSDGTSIIDKNGLEIYYSSIICGEEETNKYYYNENGDRIYTFWYYNKSTVSHIDTLNPKHLSYINEFKHSFTADEFEKLPGVDWKNMRYYHSAEPIIPE